MDPRSKTHQPLPLNPAQDQKPDLIEISPQELAFFLIMKEDIIQMSVAIDQMKKAIAPLMPKPDKDGNFPSLKKSAMQLVGKISLLEGIAPTIFDAFKKVDPVYPQYLKLAFAEEEEKMEQEVHEKEKESPDNK